MWRYDQCFFQRRQAGRNCVGCKGEWKGYKVWCVGDDIAWIRKGPDGRLYAINPENGFFGVAPGTNVKSNPNALASTKKGTIFTNVARNLDDNTVWWEGLDKNPPVNAVEWTGIETNGVEWKAEGKNLAHPNSRFTAPAVNCPCISFSICPDAYAAAMMCPF